MRHLVFAVVLGSFSLLTACTVDQAVCTNLCNAEINCMELTDNEAISALKRECISWCSVDVTKGAWSLECEDPSDDGCDEWDTDSEIDAADYKAYYQCLLDFGECKDKVFQLDADDYEECYEFLD